MNENKKHWWLYVLKLEQGKYYVGITSKGVEARFAQHKSGFAGAAWTKKYKPVSVFYEQDLRIISKNRAENFENKAVRKYIKKYGIDNVRGGNLAYTEKLVVIFGYVFSRDNLTSLIGVIFLMAVIAVLAIQLYLK